jgi:hypothetical protein
VETLGDAFAAGWRLTVRLRVGQARGHEDEARVPLHARTGPGDNGVDARAELPAIEPGRSADVPALSSAARRGSVSAAYGI